MTNLKKLILILATIIILLSAGTLSREIVLNNTPPNTQPQNSIAESYPSTTSPTTSQKQEEEPQLEKLPEKKVLENGKHTFQTFNNCGPASLSMALSYYDIAVSQKDLGDSLRPYQHPKGNNDDKSVTLTELALKATEYNLAAYHRPAGNIEILKYFINNDIPIIAKTWLTEDEDIGHYRIIKGFDSNTKTIIQDDSMQGKDLSYTYERFNNLWEKFNYEFLVLVPTGKEETALKILGDLATEKKAWETALQKADQQTKKDVSNIYAQFNRSVALYQSNRYQEAVAVYENIADKLPSRTLWYQIEPILAYYQLGEYDTVLKITSQILNNQNRAFSELYSLQGKIYELRGEEKKAQESFADAEKYNRSNYWKVNLNEI